MVKDKSKSLIQHTFLDENLRYVKDMEGRDVDVMNAFNVDSKFSHLFMVLSGSARVATTWRELPASTEVTGIVSINAGESCLVLPGEPYLVRADEKSEVSEFVLENHVQ